jgi:hypothetical protein
MGGCDILLLLSKSKGTTGVTLVYLGIISSSFTCSAISLSSRLRRSNLDDDDDYRPVVCFLGA